MLCQAVDRCDLQRKNSLPEMRSDLRTTDHHRTGKTLKQTNKKYHFVYHSGLYTELYSRHFCRVQSLFQHLLHHFFNEVHLIFCQSHLDASFIISWTQFFPHYCHCLKNSQWRFWLETECQRLTKPSFS